MLCCAISCCARAVSASASSANSVDSALASSARIRPSIRRRRARRWRPRRRGGAVPVLAGRAVPGSGSSGSSAGRWWNACSVSTAVATVPMNSVVPNAYQARR